MLHPAVPPLGVCFPRPSTCALSSNAGVGQFWEFGLKTSHVCSIIFFQQDTEFPHWLIVRRPGFASVQYLQAPPPGGV
jgi:hypothetical protein